MTYPTTWQKSPSLNPKALHFVKAPADLPNLGVYVAPSGDKKLADLPRFAVSRWAALFPHSSDHQVISERMVSLACGTMAMEFVIDWKWRGGEGEPPVDIRTVCVVAQKANTFIWIDSTNFSRSPMEISRRAANSLKFLK